MTSKNSDLEVDIRHFENVTKYKSEIIERLVSKNYPENEIIEKINTYSFKKQWKGNPLGILLIIFSLIILYTINYGLGYFQYNFRNPRGFFNFNQFITKPFLATSTFLVGLNLLLNGRYITIYTKFIMICAFVLYLLTSLKTFGEIYYMLAISVIGVVLFSAIKTDKLEYSATTQNIMEKIKIDISRELKWSGSHSFILLIVLFCLLLNSPIDLTTIIVNKTETSTTMNLSLQNIDTILTYNLIALIIVTFITAFVISINYKKFKFLFYILIIVSLSHIIGTFFHNNFQESIIPAIAILVTSLVIIFIKKPIKNTSLV